MKAFLYINFRKLIRTSAYSAIISLKILPVSAFSWNHLNCLCRLITSPMITKTGAEFFFWKINTTFCNVETCTVDIVVACSITAMALMVFEKIEAIILRGCWYFLQPYKIPVFRYLTLTVSIYQNYNHSLNGTSANVALRKASGSKRKTCIRRCAGCCGYTRDDFKFNIVFYNAFQLIKYITENGYITTF